MIHFNSYPFSDTFSVSSPLAPLAPVVLGEVLALAGVPAGVYNVVQGEGETGALLTQHQVIIMHFYHHPMCLAGV